MGKVLTHHLSLFGFNSQSKPAVKQLVVACHPKNISKDNYSIKEQKRGVQNIVGVIIFHYTGAGWFLGRILTN